MSWNDFNSAEEQKSFDVIPKGTIAKVRMSIKPGGYDDPSQGWTGGYATTNEATGSVYLNCEFVVLEGPYARRKVFSIIGLYSAKGPEWTNMGRSFIKGILNSARGLNPKDNSLDAQNKRRINGLGDLDGIEFLAKIDIGKDKNDSDKNEIRFAITSEHNDYKALMGASSQSYQAPVQNNQTVQAKAAPNPNRPSWAQ